jgi:NADH:ubiquinone oxidoreductase subunit H
VIWTFAALAILLGPMGLVLGASLSLLLERRLIAALQRRLGISFLGRQG